MKKNLTPKEIFKEMYSAARLWYNAEEINLSAPIMVDTLPGGYPFMVWFHWITPLLRYSMWIFEDGRMVFGLLDLRPDVTIEKEIRVA